MLSRALATSLLLSAALITSSCGLTGPDFDEVGEVQYVDVEGGCFGIVTNEDRYEPLNLPERFRVDGLRIRFRANRVTDMASVCQIGPLIQIESIDSIG